MALETRLDIKLSQKLVLTPQLQQAIKLLQLTQMELTQAIDQELTENPFLEESQLESPADSRESNNPDKGETVQADETASSVDSFDTFTVNDYFDERSSDGRDLGYFSPGTDTPVSFEQFTSSPTSLFDHLSWQLKLNTSDRGLLEIGEVILGNLDESGYRTIPDKELTAICNTTYERVQEAVKLVQELDPPGVCARDLQECLLLQVKALGLEGTLVQKIIEKNLSELEKRDYKGIVNEYSVSGEDILAAVGIIENLDPKPARNFSSPEINYIIPDVYVEKISDGYQIILNDETIPRLRLNREYRKLLLNKEAISGDDKTFLETKLRSATLLLKSLDYRNKTIYRVTESIIRFQKDFFDNGPKFLKPLNLREVAADIKMHESTVSRITSTKFLASPHGIFSFKHFFSSAVNGRNGSVSSTIVKELIRKTITGEDPEKPFSDQRISDILKEQNVRLARRTVAKYREELKIPPHTRRKKAKV